MWPTQPLVQLVPGLFLEGKMAGAWRSTQFSLASRLKKGYSPLCAVVACLRLLLNVDLYNIRIDSRSFSRRLAIQSSMGRDFTLCQHIHTALAASHEFRFKYD